MRRRFLVTPFLFAFASLLQLNYIASNVVSPDQLFRPLIVVWLLIGLLIWPAYWLTHDWNWAVLLLTIFAVGFSSSTSFFSTVLILVIMAGVCWVAFLRLRRMKFSLTHLMYILMGTSIFFTVYAFVLESAMLNRIPWTGYRQAVRDARSYSLTNLSGPTIKPDIYYIVVDGYARSDILQGMFKYDNSEFINSLEEKGFVVPGSNHSNYPATPLSIASTLNMDYVQAFVPALDQSPHRWLMAPFIDHSRVRALLESLGYKTISLSTNWTITENVTTDLYLRPYPVMLTDFEGFVLDLTPLQLFEPALGSFASLPTAESHREVIRYDFETLAGLANIQGPKFVFAHIISPHPPFVFDRDGKPVDSQYSFTFQDANEFPGSSKEYPRRYVEQVQYVNRKLEEMIDAILAQSGTPPIIILQADHGSGMLTDLTSPDNTCIQERFSPFAAYYLPQLTSDLIPNNISNVNIFRILFDQYFKAGLPLLENKQYFYKGTQAYYDFEDVSSRINDRCVLPKQ